ncbi:MAG TPA: beta-propeller fold lactonase family protein [Rudaea sp.]|jgi:YVTN family beta-propeller protein|nr:beta-propeller fold lactonase family protein [Rudaea sp.]
MQRTVTVSIASIAFAFGMTACRAAAVHAYVGNQENGTISIIDTGSDQVIKTVPEKGKIGEKIQAVVTDPAEKTAFVVDAKGNSLVVVDLASGEVKQTIAVGRSPEGASLSPDGKTIAVCVEDDNVVTFVDVATQKVSRKIPTQGKNPEHCVFSSDEKWLVTSNENSNDIDVIDLKAGKSIAKIATSGHPRGMALLRGKNVAYVVQELVNGVDVVDLDKKKVVATIKTGVHPADAMASRDGKRVFIANGGDGTVSAIDVATGKVLGTTPVGKRSWNMAMTPDGGKLYTANGRSNDVSVIDTATFKTIKTIPVGGLPWGVFIRSGK